MNSSIDDDNSEYSLATAPPNAFGKIGKIYVGKEFINEAFINCNEYECELCPGKFATVNELNIHITTHFEIYKCKLCNCNEELIGKTMFDYHMRAKHEYGKKRETNIKKKSSTNSIQCEFCDKSFGSAMSISTHVRRVHRIVYACCRYCKMKFISEMVLQSHYMEMHEGLPTCEPFICPICGHNLNRNFGAFRAHLRIHDVIKPYVCDTCGKDFVKKTNMIRHIRTHTGEKPLQCQLCGNQFSHESNLSQHMRVHTKAQPYKCQYCERPFSHITDLRRHKRIHEYTEKKFKCDLCEYRCYEARFLRRHQRVHDKSL